MKKSLKIISICLVVLFSVLFSTVMIYYFGAVYPSFTKIATKEFEIPGLDTKFVPQGITFDSSNKQFLISGYMSDNSPSRIYVVNTQNDNCKYVTLKQESQDYKLHAGGIAVYENYVFVSGDKTLVRFKLEDLISCNNSDAINIVDKLETGNGCDFLEIYNNQLIVGEFYKKDKYETNTNHHIKTSTDKTNYALAYIYDLNAFNTYGLNSEIPVKALSLPNQVQGMTFTKNGNIFLSTSYSIPASKLYTFKNVLNEETTLTVSIKNNNIPLYILDDNNLLSTIKAPAMSEEAVKVEDKIYLLFESNCKKYRMVNRTRLSYVYSLDIQ